MWKLLENIGLGLFVNATYSTMNLQFQPAPFVVVGLSIILMAISIYYQRRKK